VVKYLFKFVVMFAGLVMMMLAQLIPRDGSAENIHGDPKSVAPRRQMWA